MDKVKKIILFIGIVMILAFISGCSQSCEEFINEYIEENNLSQENIHNNNQGYWYIEKDGEQLTNCLEKGGRVTMYLPLE